MTELAMIKLTRPETASDPEALISRMDRLERRMGKPADPPPLEAAGAPASDSVAKQASTTESAASTPDIDEKLARAAAPLVAEETDDGEDPETPAVDISFEQVQKIWPGLFGGLRDILGARRWAFFRETVPADVTGNTILLEVAHDFHLAALEEDDAVSKIVATKAGDLLGSPVKVRFRAKAPIATDSGDDEVDISSLEERPDLDTDPASLLASELGAEVVDD